MVVDDLRRSPGTALTETAAPPLTFRVFTLYFYPLPETVWPTRVYRGFSRIYRRNAVPSWGSRIEDRTIEARRRSDVGRLATGGLLNLTGSAVGGALGFTIVVIATRSLGPSGAGLFFEGVAFLSISSHVLLLGADVGLVRSIGAHRSRGEIADVRQTLVAALIPTFLVGVLAAAVAYVATPALAAILDRSGSGEALVRYLRVFVVALPFAAVYLACVAATRGFGTMLPAVVIDKIGKPLLQVILLFMTVSFGWGAIALAASWTIPIVIALGAALTWLVLAARHDPSDPATSAPRTAREIFFAFWRFSLPRGIAATFQVLILWLDTLLIGILASAHAAGVYTASTRYVLLGTFVGVAIAQAVAPQLASMFASGHRDRARALFGTATTWGIAATWPLFLTLAIYSRTVLLVFGSRFEEGAGVLAILSLAMLLASATGPVDWVLLMGGKSGWNLLNTALALAVNIALNLVLIPRIGITGAAIAWAASIIVNSVVPLLEAWLLLGMHPFNLGGLLAAAASVVCFGGVAVTIRAFLGDGVLALIVSIVASSVLYLGIVWRSRGLLDVEAIAAAVRPRRGERGALTGILGSSRSGARASR
jgi:O-antigen/teichoic acid export membrane protein